MRGRGSPVTVAEAGVHRAWPALRVREHATHGAQLFAASGFALAQPLLDILGKNPEFFAVRGSSGADIVRFAIAVTLLPPLILLAAEILVGLASAIAARALHLVFIGGLSAIIALHALTKNDVLDGAAALAVAALLGAGAAALLWGTKFVGSFLSVLALAPLVFLALFLFDSPVSKLISSETAQASTVKVQSKTPVVLIVFDELATVSLMDRNGRIDAARWPHFAALARTSTWFRNATTVHPHTQHAVPAIMDGKLPEPGLLPIFADHPQNVFTFLGGSYELQVLEALTHLCPPSLCKQKKAASFDPSSEDETGSLASDAGIVYLHLVLPRSYAADLPPISNTWGNFGGPEPTDEGSERAIGGTTRTFPACGRGICRLASVISAERNPTLYFVHSLLPHAPWLYLPSGTHYGGDVRVIPGTENGVFVDDRWLTTQAEQRYLLQLGYTDEGLGILLRRLRATGVFDRALVVVVADHGISFRPGEPRRNVTERNLSDIAFMPLFVKLPGQSRGRIDDGFARTVDIFPTIAHVLRERIPWRVDGKTLIGRRLPADASVSLLSSGGRAVAAPLRTLRARRAESLTRQAAVFGSGQIDRVYRIGPHPALLGKRVTALRVRPSTKTGVELNGRELLGLVDLSTNLLPSYLTGTITGSHPPQQDLAVAVNGTIRAVTRSYTEFGETKFSALVPEKSFRNGSNSVTVYAVSGTATAPLLEELRGSDATYSLGGQGAIEASDGKTIRVTRAISGEVRGSRRAAEITLGGWAADLNARRAAGSILVFVDGRSVFVGRNGNIRRDDLIARHGVTKAGFIFRLPSSLLPEAGDDHEVRVFALAGDVASELRYLPGYPWATGG